MTDALPGRAGVAVLAVVAGAVVGCATVLLHRYWWGLLLGILATATLMVAVPGGWWRRLPFALGWVAVVLLLAGERPEGDLLVTQTTSGYLLLAAGVGVLLAGVIGLRRHPDPNAAINGRDAASS